MVAEESFEAKANGSAPERFILVDPLDGTREFITGSHEFTVNIALVEQGKPVVGCVYAPALNQMYVAGADAWRADVRPGDALPRAEAMQKLVTEAYPSRRPARDGEPLASRSGNRGVAEKAAGRNLQVRRLLAKILQDCPGRR